MNPLCAVLAQFNGTRVYVLEEMILPDSNTPAACEELLNRTRKWNSGSPLHIYVYGDATGEQRRSSASRTDWQIVKDFFGYYPDRYRASFRVPSTNPPVKDRVNALPRNHARPVSALGRFGLQRSDQGFRAGVLENGSPCRHFDSSASWGCERSRVNHAGICSRDYSNNFSRISGRGNNSREKETAQNDYCESARTERGRTRQGDYEASCCQGARARGTI